MAKPTGKAGSAADSAWGVPATLLGWGRCGGVRCGRGRLWRLVARVTRIVPATTSGEQPDQEQTEQNRADCAHCWVPWLDSCWPASSKTATGNWPSDDTIASHWKCGSLKKGRHVAASVLARPRADSGSEPVPCFQLRAWGLRITITDSRASSCRPRCSTAG